MRSNHKIIGIQLAYDMKKSVRELVNSFHPDLLDEVTPLDGKEIAYSVHLGYVTPDDVLRDIMRRGADCAIAHFEEKGDTRKDHGSYLYQGLMLCLLMGDRTRLVRLCACITPRKRPIQFGWPFEEEDEIYWIYLVLAGFFQEKPDKRFDKLRAAIAACRTRNVRVLSRALEAVAQRDEEAFAPAIQACVEHHRTKPKPRPDWRLLGDWMPRHANAIYLAGLCLGLKQPTYPPEIAAYLMTPESVGFGPEREPGKRRVRGGGRR